MPPAATPRPDRCDRQMQLELALEISFVLVAYFVGGIPSAYLFGHRLHDADIRMLGSRNVGTLNSFRLFGWRAGLAVLVADVAKGAVVIAAAGAMGAAQWTLFGAAAAVTLGHNWSPYLRLTGGKGVAVLLGVSLAMAPVQSVAAFPFVLVAWVISRHFLIAIGAGIVSLNVLIALSDASGEVVSLCIALTAVVVTTHFARVGAGDLARAASASCSDHRDVRHG